MDTSRIYKRTYDKGDISENFSIAWILYGVQYLFLFTVFFIINKYYPNFLLIHPSGFNGNDSQITYYFMIAAWVTFVIVLLISWRQHRLSVVTLLIGYFAMVFYVGITANLFLKAWAPRANLGPYLGVMILPGPLIIIMGLLGYFKLVNIKKTWAILIFVGIGIFISFLALFFAKIDLDLITSNKEYQGYIWFVPFFFSMIFFIKNAIDFHQIQSSLQYGRSNTKKEMYKITLFHGIGIFFKFSILLLSWVFGIFKRRRESKYQWRNEE